MCQLSEYQGKSVIIQPTQHSFFGGGGHFGGEKEWRDKTCTAVSKRYAPARRNGERRRSRVNTKLLWVRTTIEECHIPNKGVAEEGMNGKRGRIETLTFKEEV